MPDYEAVIDGKARKIELTRKSPECFEAKLDGKPRDIKIQKMDLTSERAFTLEVDGKTYRIELPKVEGGKITPINIEGTSFNVEVKIATRGQTVADFEAVPQAATKKIGSNRKTVIEGAIPAPMTGKIVQVRVKKGDQVKAGQVLCVIEAMKMENEISAPKAGVVRDVNVAGGASVNEGDTLFVIV